MSYYVAENVPIKRPLENVFQVMVLITKPNHCLKLWRPKLKPYGIIRRQLIEAKWHIYASVI